MRKAVCAVLFLAICPIIVAQQALNNDSIIKMVKAQLSTTSSSPPSTLRPEPMTLRLTPSSRSSRPASATK